jgi:4-alpha-glucanotransferase
MQASSNKKTYSYVSRKSHEYDFKQNMQLRHKRLSANIERYLYFGENTMRKSGVLMHISSLPSPYGIGSLGAEARKFVNFLSDSGQSCWQVLPVSPTGFGDSPYQSFSSFAGNPYFIDFDLLCDAGLLNKAEYCDINWGLDPERVDYGLVYDNKFGVLRKAASRLLAAGNVGYSEFCSKEAYWLDDYALFMALKDSHTGQPFTNWEKELCFREEYALEKAKNSFREEIELYKAIQYFFFSQWDELKKYAHERNVSIIGDMPIYVAPDSADVWAHPDLFQLDRNMNPTDVAGCPPDGFTEDGQLWGNPLYDWEENQKQNYFWWISRINRQFEIYDVLRIDHFRGFDEYYAIPFGSENAKNGVWRRGPGMHLFNAVKNTLGEKQIIAEDLGFLNKSVHKLLSDSGYPGMKVLQFAFDGSVDSDYLPHNYSVNCVAYAGTHDNDTINGWLPTLPHDEAIKAREYLRIHSSESEARATLSVLWESVAFLTVALMQDLLELDSSGRMNTPSTLGNNWQWRMRPDTDLSEVSAWLKKITTLYAR